MEEGNMNREMNRIERARISSHPKRDVNPEDLMSFAGISGLFFLFCKPLKYFIGKKLFIV